MVLIIFPPTKKSKAKMMHSSSSVGAGPYDPGSAAEDECDTNETLACDAAITPAPAHNEPELCSPNPETDLLQNKEKPEVSRRQHRRSRPPYQQDRVSAQLHSNRNGVGSGWCELSVECDRTGGAQDDFSFAPASSNHENVQGDNDDDEEGENDYVWGPQHLNLFISGYRADHLHGAYEAATAAASSVQSSGRTLVGSLYSHLHVPGHSKLKVEPSGSNVDEEAGRITQNDLPYELAPPAAASMSRGYSTSSHGDPFARDIISSSVHTETYIFEDANNNEGIDASGGIFDGDKPLFSRGESVANASRNIQSTCSEDDDDASYATANSDMNAYDEDVVLSGISLVDDDGDTSTYITSQGIDNEITNMKQTSSFQEGKQDDNDAIFYNADEQEHTLRTEVVEVLHEDISRVNDAFLDTVHKTSALMQPIAEAARMRRQSGASSPVRQRLSNISRSISERASSTATVVIPTRQSIREKSARLWKKAYEAEETLVHAAYETEKTVIAAAPTIRMPEAISDTLKSVEAAAEELRVNDVDVQSSVDDAELLSQLTAGAYA